MRVARTPAQRAQGQFDTFLFADYSGAESATAQRSAISLFRVDGPTGEPRKIVGPFTRTTLRETIVEELRQATSEGRRVLFGLDHQWSWPRDLKDVAGLGGANWRTFLATLVSGTKSLPPLGAPSEYACAFNAATGQPVFHCRVHSLGHKYGLPRSSAWPGNPVRLVETLMSGAKPATRLGGTGAVAGQTLTGLKELHLLFQETTRRTLPVKAWPFDVLHDDGVSHLGCEIYPAYCKRDLKARGLFRTRPDWTEHDRDAALTSLWASRTDLAPLLDLRKETKSTQTMARTEGWILGARGKA